MKYKLIMKPAIGVKEFFCYLIVTTSTNPSRIAFCKVISSILVCWYCWRPAARDDVISRGHPREAPVLILLTYVSIFYHPLVYFSKRASHTFTAATGDLTFDLGWLGNTEHPRKDY
jgi:hypothetical protein